MRREKQRRPRRRISSYMAKKSCRFCRDKIRRIEYRNIDVLSRYTTEQGKILARRISGNCSYHQRQVSKAVKRARTISLLPYTGE